MLGSGDRETGGSASDDIHGQFAGIIKNQTTHSRWAIYVSEIDRVNT
jgi:hypothetical protein